MRLIDADAMHIDFDKYVEHIRRMRKGKIPKAEIAILLDCKDIIDNAPTVYAVPMMCIDDYLTMMDMSVVEFIDFAKKWLAERKEE